MNRGKVWLVGAGPGDPGLLTLKGARAIQNCDTLVYDYLASQAIVDLAPPQCERIYVGKRAGTHSLTQAEITELTVKLAREGKRVVRLKGGDVFVFARGGEEAQALRNAGVPFEIVPGITSAIAVPAYAGIPVTHRDHNTTFSISTGHEDPLKGYTSLDYAKLANPKSTTIFLMAMATLPGVIGELRKHGLPDTTPVAIVRDGTKPTQETLVGTLGTIVADVERARFAAPAVVIVGSVVNERESIRWFDRTTLFGKRVLITRPAKRVSRSSRSSCGNRVPNRFSRRPSRSDRRTTPRRPSPPLSACAITRGSCSPAATAWTRSSRFSVPTAKMRAPSAMRKSRRSDRRLRPPSPLTVSAWISFPTRT